MRLTVRGRLFLSHFLSALLVSGSILGVVYVMAVQNLAAGSQSRVAGTAALIGQTLDATEIETVADASDPSHATYQRYLSKLHHLAHTTPDIKRLAVMRHSWGRVYDVVDSDASAGHGVSSREHPDPTEALLRGFQMPAVEDKTAADVRGSFLSGYAPLRNGDGEYLVRVDMRADDIKRKLAAIRAALALSLGLCALLALLLSGLLSHRLAKPLRTLVRRCRSLASGESDRPVDSRGGDELEDLLDTFGALFRQLADARSESEKMQQLLQQTRDVLDLRVAERTRDLMEANERLLREVAERARAEELLSHAAHSDPLTGLMNRRAMLEQLEYQTARFQRNHTPFTLLLGDLDNFKAINDTFGHDAGDQALIQTARHIVHGIRAQDLVARWGGEEFLILLPDTDLAGGVVVAEALREAIASKGVAIGDGTRHITLSLGVAEYNLGQTINQFIKAADTALYQAKVGGRNRVVAAPTPAPPDAA
jgi:diguanylate cyclase (GGDEF)-like protein